MSYDVFVRGETRGNVGKRLREKRKRFYNYGDDFTKETIRIEYEWRPPRCDEYNIFGHVHDHCPKKVAIPPIVITSNVAAPTIEKSNDGFQTMGKRKKRKGKFKSTNGDQFANPFVKQIVRYEPKATPSAPKKGATCHTPPRRKRETRRERESSQHIGVYIEKLKHA
nr:zinc knuckle CX2CX4HX4C [Tanacetum cinerariifolium]